MSFEHKMIEFDIFKRERLRAAYHSAVKEQQHAFTFEGEEYMTAYAKYVLEYLDGRPSDGALQN